MERALPVDRAEDDSTFDADEFLGEAAVGAFDECEERPVFVAMPGQNGAVL